MPSKEQKLEVALAHLMQKLPAKERVELPSFIDNMPQEGVDWWLSWAQKAIERRRAQNALLYRFQQKPELQRFSMSQIERMLNQFTDEGLDVWFQDVDIEKYSLAVIRAPEVLPPADQRQPTEVFQDLFREIVWVNEFITPPLQTMGGIDHMIHNLTTISQEHCPLEDIGIYKGQLYAPRNGQYVPHDAELFCPFDYSRVYSGLMLHDYEETFGVIAFHSSPHKKERIPARTQFSLLTTQDPELRNMQQLRMQFYDEGNQPCTSADSYTIVGDLTTLEDGNLIDEESFVLKQHAQKNLFSLET